MYRSFTTLIFSLLILCLPVLGSVNAQEASQQEAPAAEVAEEELPARQVRIPTEKSLALFNKRVEKNPKDYQSWTVLGRLYLRHAKESDDHSAVGKAEHAFRKAIEIKPDNLTAKSYLATALQTRHEFAEALKLAQEVFEKQPRDTLALATIGDSQLELGRYDEAEKSYAKLASRAKSPAVAARLAHLAELKGDTPTAIRLTESALKNSVETGRSGSYLAWYHFRLADLHEGSGKLEQAAEHYRKALELEPDYAPAMSGLANVLALQGKDQQALKLYQQAVDTHGEPPMMAALGDLHMHLGQAEKAQKLYDQADEVMAEEAKTAAAAHYREVSLFYSNHDRKLPRALELAQADMKMRQDIYAYDTLAWALHKNDQDEAARKAIEQALHLGTRDANLYFHAGMIYQALGDKAKARESLQTAVEINPHFSLLNASVASGMLESAAVEQ